MISPVPDIRTLQIDPAKDSYIVLACDGIWNSLTSQEVVDFVSERMEKLCSTESDPKDPTTQHLKTICEEVISIDVLLSKFSTKLGGHLNSFY